MGKTVAAPFRNAWVQLTAVMSPIDWPLRRLGFAVCLAAALGAGLTGCASLPSLEGRRETFALIDTEATRLGRAIAPRVVANAPNTGVYVLPIATDAFAARMLLAAAAEKTLDIQYFIWHGDQTGYLLMEQVWRAAERGVRVRMLLDDLNTHGLDETLAALGTQPNIEIRLYNPFVYRNARSLNFLSDFVRVNRRMHNKSFTADNQVAIVGGRNVGNEYFAAGSEVPFKDLDVIAVGPAVRDISDAFDLYWNSPSSFPVARIVATARPDDVQRLSAKFSSTRIDPIAGDYMRAVSETSLLAHLLAGQLALEWTQARLVRDDPVKTTDTTGRTDILLLTDLLEAAGRPETSFDLISPYFVPGETGTAALTRLVQRGVKVRVLTNSLASTDGLAAHAGYAKRRCDLLRAGVQLYELKPSSDDAKKKTRITPESSSSMRLHAKTFAVDRTRLFVGSFNFDPRSARLNTEMGLLIDSSELAHRLSRAFDVDVPNIAYETRLATGGNCVDWVERTSAGEVHYAIEPATDAWQRALIEFLSVLPIDWLL